MHITQHRYERRGTKEITLVLEYLPGGDLFSLLIARKTFDIEMTRFYTACAYFALCHMHSRNILCRDLKLENMAIATDTMSRSVVLLHNDSGIINIIIFFS